MKNIKIFLSAMIIVMLGTTNIFLISEKMYIYAVLISGFISLCWTSNVKSIAFCNWKERLFYILGGIVGTTISLYFLTLIFEKL
jgi:hypothetical protein